MATFRDPSYTVTEARPGDGALIIRPGLEFEVWTGPTSGTRVQSLTDVDGRTIAHVTADQQARLAFIETSNSYDLLWLRPRGAAQAGLFYRVIADETLSGAAQASRGFAGVNARAQAAEDAATAARDSAKAATERSTQAQTAADEAVRRVDLIAPLSAGDVPGTDVIVILGQSNAVGRGSPIEPRLDPADDHVFVFGSTGPLGNQITQAVDPLPHWDPRDNTVGPGMEFARQYSRSLPASRRVLLVPAAQGATAFTAGDKRWRVSHTPPEQNLYLLALRQVRLALTAAGNGARFVGIIWHQGESDAGQTQAAYHADLRGVLSGFRTELGAPEAWMVVGGLCAANFWGTGSGANRRAMDQILRAFPATHDRTAYAYGNPYHVVDDPLHFSAPGSRHIGRQYALSVPLAIANVPNTELLPPTRLRDVQGPPQSVTVRWDRPLARFDDFQVEHRNAGSTGAWSRATRTAPDPGNEQTLPPATPPQEVRVRALLGGTTSPWSEPATLTPTPWLISTDVPARRAYALRRVVAAYTGPAVRVRRSSDNGAADFGFTADGILDVNAVLAYCGAGSGFVATWYDQSGQAGHLTQATAAAQPMIVNTGAIVQEDGRATLAFDGVDDHLFSTTVPGVAASTAFTVLEAGRFNSTSAAGRVWCEGSTAADAAMIGQAGSAVGAQTALFWRPDSNSPNTNITDPLTPSNSNALQVLGVSDNSTAGRFYSNLRESDPVARARTGATTTNRWAVGAMIRTTTSSWLAMRLSELHVWTVAVTDDERRRVTTNMATHHRLPMAGSAAR